MLGQIGGALEYLGGRVQWQAVSAIGTILAFIWTIRLANRQAVDRRRRDAATIKALMVILLPVIDAIEPATEASAGMAKAQAKVDGLRLRGDEGAKAEAHMLFDIARDKAGAAVNELKRRAGRAERRLRDIDPLTLPSTTAIERVEQGLAALAESYPAIESLKGRSPKRDAVEALRSRLTFVVGSLGQLAQAYGGSADGHDAHSLHNWLGSRVLKAQRAFLDRRRTMAWLRREQAKRELRMKMRADLKRQLRELEDGFGAAEGRRDGPGR